MRGFCSGTVLQPAVIKINTRQNSIEAFFIGQIPLKVFMDYMKYGHFVQYGYCLDLKIV